MKLTTILFTILFSTSVFAAGTPADHKKKVDATTTEKTVTVDEATTTEKTEEKK